MHHQMDSNNIVCIDRETGTCNVLRAETEKALDLASLGKSMGASKVLFVVPEERIEELLAIGWSLETNLKVVSFE